MTQHEISQEKLREYPVVRYVAEKLQAAGYKAYIVGGAVRDLLLGYHPKDFDLATNAQPDQIPNVPGLESAFYKDAAQAYGVTRVHIHGEELEVATFRRDIEPHLGRKATKIEFAELEDDLHRRDISVNAIALDPISGEIVDLVGGVQDIEQKVIRFIGEPMARIHEDPVRILRAIRFKNKLGFEYDAEAKSALFNSVREDLVETIAVDRLRRELSLMFAHQSRRHAIEDLDYFDILDRILPEVTAAKGVPQPPEFHAEGDVWNHQMLAMDALPENPSKNLAWATLLHDIGKPPTETPPQEPGDRVHFNKHYSVGAEMTRKILKRFNFSKYDTELITWMVHYHLSIDDLPNMTRSHQLRMLSHPAFEDLFALHKADSTASWSLGREQETPEFPEIEQIWHKFQAQPPEERRPSLKKDLGIDGDWLIREFGDEFDLKQNPIIGTILEALQQLYHDEGVKDIDYYYKKARGILEITTHKS